MPTPGGTWLHLKRWCSHLPGSARFVSFCYKFVLYPAYCNTLLCEWIIKEFEETFEGDCRVRGYLVTEKQWKDTAIGESLTLCHEGTLSTTHVRWHREHGPGNGRMNVQAYPGSIRIELSSTLRFFVKHGRNISAKVR